MDAISIDPQVVAEMVDSLARRLRSRAENLLASQESWRIEGRCWALGSATLTLAEVDVITSADQLICDCLLAPACAHRPAVALALPISDYATATVETPEVPNGQPDRPAGMHLAEVVKPPNSAGAPKSGLKPAEHLEPADSLDLSAVVPVVLTDGQLAAVAQCANRCAELLQVGIARMPVTLQAGLRADLHRLRVHQLVRADRELTALLTAETTVGQVTAFGQLMSNLRALAAGTVDAELVGHARASYRTVGGLQLSAVLAEPIDSGSGYSGVAVTFAGTDGRLWSLTRIGPSELGGVAQHYRAGEPWGGVSESLLVLSRRRLLVSNATAAPSGRLGGGRQVRAALLDRWPGWGAVADPLRVVQGPITGGDRRTLAVGGELLELTPTAIRLGAGLGTELFGQACGTAVQALARRSAVGWELLGVRFDDDRFQLPNELARVWWPGLDTAQRSWTGELTAPEADHQGAVDQWPTIPPSVTAVTRRWLTRVLVGSASALAPDAAAVDVAWLRAAGAPFAAELLQRLVAATHVGTRRFDGQWVADPTALAQAWLALSQY